MSSEQTSSNPSADCPANPSANPGANPGAEPSLSARTQRHLAILERLAQQGADIAARLHEQVIEPIPAGPILAALGGSCSFVVITHEIVAAFDQIARAVRRTILLAQRLAEPPPPAISRAHPKAAQPVTREREEAIRPLRSNPAEPELVQPEYQDRLDPMDREDELGTRSIPDIIASIRHDLDAGAKQQAHLSNHQTPEDGGRCERSNTPPSAPHPSGMENSGAKAVAREHHPTNWDHPETCSDPLGSEQARDDPGSAQARARGGGASG